MEQPKDEVSRPDRIRYRLTWLQSLLSIAAPVVPFGVVALMSVWAGEPVNVVTAESSGIWVAALFVMLVIGRYFGVTLTRSSVIVHNVRRRTIRWSNVQAVRVERSQGTRTVVIYEADGRRTRLSAPTTGLLRWDRGFEEKFHSIGRWWLDHRGPDWVPVLGPWHWDGPPAPRISPYAPPV